MTNLTLYEIIKQKSKEKGRPLKIICDWDETIQPLKPTAIYEKIINPKISFKEFFEWFWDNTKFSPSPSGRGFFESTHEGESIKIRGYLAKLPASEEVKEAIKGFEKERQDIRKSDCKWDSYAKSFYGRPERFSAPFLSIAEDLVKLCKEGKVKILIISSYNNNQPDVMAAIRKRKKIESSFGLLPNTSIELTIENEKKRWKVIEEKYSDFDILIDDSLKVINETRKIFPTNIYIIPDYKHFSEKWDYKYAEQNPSPNVYRLKTTVSDLKDEDFEKVAQELKARKTQQSQPKPEPKNYWPWIIGGSLAVGSLIILLGFYFWNRKSKKKI